MISKFSKDLKFVTLTYDKKNHTMEAIEHFYSDYMKIVKHVMNAKVVTQYRLWCELTGTGQLHFHIICEPKDTVKFKIACGWWAKNRGFVDTRPVTDLDGLQNTYLEKERKEMEEYIFRGGNPPSFPLREDTDPSVIEYQYESYLTEKHMSQKRKAIIEDLKLFSKIGKQEYFKDHINYIIPPLE